MNRNWKRVHNRPANRRARRNAARILDTVRV